MSGIADPPGTSTMTLSPAGLERFVSQLANRPELWRHLVRHSDSTRIYEQIWSSADVNAWLICWSEDQDTGFHDHDDSAAAIEVISGQVREDRLTIGGEDRTRFVGPGERLLLPATAIHRVLHAGDRPAVTIHAYSPPLRRTGAYTIDTDGTLLRAAQPYEVELAAEHAPALA